MPSMSTLFRIHPCLFTLIASLCVMPQSALAQFELPDTDLWLITMDDGNINLNTPPQAIASTSNYENQPAFSHDGKTLYYTLGDDKGYTDIAAVKLDNRERYMVEQTPLSEFSPLPLPAVFQQQSPHSVAVVQVQADASQYLMQIQPQSETGSSTWHRISPSSAVGYHTWLINQAGELGSVQFIVDEPSRLEYWPRLLSGAHEKPVSQDGIVIAERVGRGLASISLAGHTEWIYFVQQQDNGNAIHQWSPETQTSQPVFPLPERVEDFAIASHGDFWCGLGSRLYRRRIGESHWQLMADLQEFGIYNITRLTLQAQGRALVLAASN